MTDNASKPPVPGRPANPERRLLLEGLATAIGARVQSAAI